MGDYVRNNEWRLARSVAAGWSADGGEPAKGSPVPAAVQRLAVRWEAEHGMILPRDTDGDLTYGAIQRLPDCALKRAALTLADDTPEERDSQYTRLRPRP